MISLPVSDRDLIRAIELRCSPVFGALNVANALGGLQTDDWRLVREFTLEQLIDEAVKRDIDLSNVKAALCDVLVFDTPPFQGAIRYDPRSRCRLCGLPHFIRSGVDRSCGRNQRTFNPPTWRWSRTTAEAAFEGTYLSPTGES